jgi:hypothetical protein
MWPSNGQFLCFDTVGNRIPRGRPGQPPRGNQCGPKSSPNPPTDTSALKIRSARSDDLVAIKVLVSENELPASDITEDLLSDFAVVEDADGSVVGSVGLQ